MQKSLQWIVQKTIVMTLTLVKWAECWRGSVVGSWLLDLTADVLRRDREALMLSLGVSPILARDVGLFTLLWTLGYPLLSSVVHCGRVLSHAVLVLSTCFKVLNGMRAMFGGHDVR